MTLTKIEQPTKCNSSYGNWKVRYSYTYPLMYNNSGEATAIRFFWKKSQAVEWFKWQGIGRPVTSQAKWIESHNIITERPSS